MNTVLVSSRCPKCGRDCIQYGHNQEELVQRLRSGEAIRAYCAVCEVFWEISVKERAEIVRGLNN